MSDLIIVRCGECKWYEKEDDVDGYCDKNGLMIWDKDWYCADGERKGEEDGEDKRCRTCDAENL